jgi:hypothetical protein
MKAKKRYLKPTVKLTKIKVSFFRKPSRTFDEFEGLFLATRTLYDNPSN